MLKMYLQIQNQDQTIQDQGQVQNQDQTYWEDKNYANLDPMQIYSNLKIT